MNSEPAQNAPKHNTEQFLNTSSNVYSCYQSHSTCVALYRPKGADTKDIEKLTIIKSYFIGGLLDFDLKRPAAVALLISGLTCAAFRGSNRN